MQIFLSLQSSIGYIQYKISACSRRYLVSFFPVIYATLQKQITYQGSRIGTVMVFYQGISSKYITKDYQNRIKILQNIIQGLKNTTKILIVSKFSKIVSKSNENALKYNHNPIKIPSEDYKTLSKLYQNTIQIYSNTTSYYQNTTKYYQNTELYYQNTIKKLQRADSKILDPCRAFAANSVTLLWTN